MYDVTSSMKFFCTILPPLSSGLRQDGCWSNLHEVATVNRIDDSFSSQILIEHLIRHYFYHIGSATLPLSTVSHVICRSMIGPPRRCHERERPSGSASAIGRMRAITFGVRGETWRRAWHYIGQRENPGKGLINVVIAITQSQVLEVRSMSNMDILGINQSFPRYVPKFRRVP